MLIVSRLKLPIVFSPNSGTQALLFAVTKTDPVFNNEKMQAEPFDALQNDWGRNLLSERIQSGTSSALKYRSINASVIGSTKLQHRGIYRGPKEKTHYPI